MKPMDWQDHLVVWASAAAAIALWAILVGVIE